MTWVVQAGGVGKSFSPPGEPQRPRVAYPARYSRTPSPARIQNAESRPAERLFRYLASDRRGIQALHLSQTQLQLESFRDDLAGVSAEVSEIGGGIQHRVGLGSPRRNVEKIGQMPRPTFSNDFTDGTRVACQYFAAARHRVDQRPGQNERHGPVKVQIADREDSYEFVRRDATDEMHPRQIEVAPIDHPVLKGFASGEFVDR